MSEQILKELEKISTLMQISLCYKLSKINESTPDKIVTAEKKLEEGLRMYIDYCTRNQ